MTTLLAACAGGTLVLALALAATSLLQRRSAALRHAVLASAVVTALLMPAFELLLPQLPVVRWGTDPSVTSSGLTLSSETAAADAADETVTTAAAVPWTTLLFATWILGAVATTAALVTGLARLARLSARCTQARGRWRELGDELARECGVRRRVELLESADCSLLVTCGVLRPRIILPAGASAWADDRARVVLRHELAHIRRHDTLLQAAGEALRVLHWFNPLAWAACRRLRQESEYACDDAVLRGGVEPADYATELLDVARCLTGRQPRWTPAHAIAHPSTLERRIVAMLHEKRDRTPLGRRGGFAVALAALAVGMPLAAAGVAPADREDVVLAAAAPAAGLEADTATRATGHPPGDVAEPGPARAGDRSPTARQPSSIAGSVLDQSGGALPGAEVTLVDTRTGAEQALHTDAAGRFTFRDLGPARYELLVAGLLGFRTVSDVVTLGPGADVRRTITLPLGSLEETVTVACVSSLAARIRRVARAIDGGLFPALHAQAPQTPIRIGGNLRAPRKVRNVNPLCPQAPPTLDATVHVTGRIATDGTLVDLAEAPGDPGANAPAELVESALEAVRQWTFTPTLLNGVAVEVDISVRVTFTRQ